MKIDHSIIQTLIMRAIKNILIKKYKIQLPDDVIEEVSNVATEDIITVEEAYKNNK